MKVQRWFLNNSLRNYQYLLHDNQHAIAIDPLKSDIYLDFIKERSLSLKAILITHSHGDHIAGVNKLIEAFPNVIIYSYRDNEVFSPDVYVKDNDVINLGFCTFKVLYTPGHIPDHVCYLFDIEKALFCGDTLFNAGVGGVKDSTANVDQLYDSIVKINKLDPNICLYSAHDYWESNLNFALSILPEDEQFLYYKNNIAKLSAIDKPILNITEESRVNIFMRSINDASILDKFPKYELGRELFIKLRGLKDIF